MATINIKCPVCGDILDNGVCPKCGYLQIVFPEVVPDSLKDQESKRISIAKRCFDETAKLNEQNQINLRISAQSINGLKKTLGERESAIKQSQKEISDLKSEIRDQLKEKDKLNAQLRTALITLKSNESEIDRMSKKINSQNSEIDKLEQQLKSSSEKVAAYLLIKDDGEFSVVPVTKKRWIFASGPALGSNFNPDGHIVMLPVMTPIAIEFSIEKRDSGAYYLRDFKDNLVNPRFDIQAAHVGREYACTASKTLRLANGEFIKIKNSDIEIYFCIDQQ